MMDSCIGIQKCQKVLGIFNVLYVAVGYQDSNYDDKTNFL